MFELPTMTTVRILDVRTLAAKDRKPDEPPGAQLLVQANMQIADLAMFDPALPAMLARKAPTEGKKQGQLDGIEVLELTEIGAHMKRIPWIYDATGVTVEIDRGLGGASNLVLHDCTVHRVSFQPEKGVSAKVQWTIDAPGQSDSVRGKLTGMKATDMPITQVGPEVSGQADIEDKAPRLTPAQLRAANTEGKTIEQKAAEVKGAAGMGTVAWPFPQDGTPGSGPKAKSVPQDATSAVLADVKKNGPGHSANPKPKPAVKSRRAAPIKMANPPAQYRDPKSGQSWTGRGLKPLWLTQALAGGAKLDDFQVKAH